MSKRKRINDDYEEHITKKKSKTSERKDEEDGDSENKTKTSEICKCSKCGATHIKPLKSQDIEKVPYIDLVEDKENQDTIGEEESIEISQDDNDQVQEKKMMTKKQLCVDKSKYEF